MRQAHSSPPNPSYPGGKLRLSEFAFPGAPPFLAFVLSSRPVHELQVFNTKQAFRGCCKLV